MRFSWWFQVCYEPDGAGAAAGAQGAAGADGAATAAAAAAGSPWYQGKDGVDDRLVGHWKNRYPGQLDDPVKVAIAATKGHMEAEKFIGAPANQLLRLPADAKDEAGWNAVWARLGAPADAKEYEFKTPDGKAVDEKLDATLRQIASETKLPKETAARVGASVAKFLQAAEVEGKAAYDAKLAEERVALDKNWGSNKDANLLVAKQAAAKLGVAPEAVMALESVVGYAKVMEMFRTIGAKMGEAPFIGNDTTTQNNGVMSRDQAVAKKAELMGDTQWSKRYLDGGAAEVREMTMLNTIIVSGA